MKRLLAIILALLAFRAPAAEFPLVTGDRLVFTGDSLLRNDGYPNYGEMLGLRLVLFHPDILLHIQSFGRSGMAMEGMLDSTAVGYQHYGKYVEPLSPTYVFSMWADNGGYAKSVYKAFLDTYCVDYMIGRNSAKPVLLGIIPQSDADGYVPGPDYDDANEELALAATPDYYYAPLWRPLQSVWRSYQTMTASSATGFITTGSAHGWTDGMRVILWNGTPPSPLVNGTIYYIRDVTSTTFKVAATLGGSAITLTTNGSGSMQVSHNWAYLRGVDEIHPSAVATQIATWKIVTGLGWDTTVSTATVSATTNQATVSHCTVDGIRPNGFGGIDFCRLDDRYPMPALSASVLADALELFPSMANWQTYSVTVSGLTSGTYDVYINGVLVGSKTHTELAAGWNMSDLTVGPVYETGIETLKRIRLMQGQDPVALTGITSPTAEGCRLFEGACVQSYETLGNRGSAHTTNSGVVATRDKQLRTITWNSTTDRATLTAHGYVDNMVMRLNSTALYPSKATGQAYLHDNGDYFIRNKGNNDFQISDTSGGSAIDISGTGTGTQSIYDTRTIGHRDVMIKEAAQPQLLTYSLRKQGATYTPPVGIAAPSFGMTEAVTDYSASGTYDFGAGAVSYPNAGYGPYTHYVDNTSGSATDTANAYGSPSTPRLTIPDNVPAGSIIELHGGPYAWHLGSSLTGGSGATRGTSGCAGTITNPCFIRGTSSTSRVVISSWATDLNYKMSYTVIENLKFDPLGAPGAGAFIFHDNSHHIAMRKCTFANVPSTANQSALNVSYSSSYQSGMRLDNFLFWDIRFDNIGERYPTTFEGISAAILENGLSECWFLNCTTNSASEDGLHLAPIGGNSGIVGTGLYIGNNSFFRDGENAIDVKNFKNVIISGNVMKGYRATSYPASGSDGAAVVINDEGANDNIWTINNIFADCVIGIRAQNSTVEDGVKDQYHIGNIFYDIALDPILGTGGECININGAANAYIANNTFNRYNAGIVGSGGDNYFIWNNIFANRTNGAEEDVWINNQPSVVVSAADNLYYPTKVALKSGFNWTDSITADPLFTDGTANNYTLQSSSPAKDAATAVSAAYTIFSSTYSRSIAYDINGNARPNGNWDIGAFENLTGSGGGGTGTLTTGTLNAGTLNFSPP